MNAAEGWPAPVHHNNELVVTAGRRLRAIRESGDLSLAFGPEADRELRRLKRESGGDPHAAFALGWLYWYRHERLAAPGAQPTEEGRRAYAALMPCFIRGMQPIPGGLFADIAIGSAYQATMLLDQAMAAHDADAIMAAAALWRRIQAAVPVSAAEWPRVMVMLCVALQGSFEVTAEVADLDAAVDAGRRGIAAVPADDPRLGMLLANFAAALRMRSAISGTRQHADEAVAVLRQAVAATSGGDREHSARCLADLGDALRIRHAVTGAGDDLDEAIGLLREADGSMHRGDPAGPAIRSDLGLALDGAGETEEAVTTFRSALGEARDGHPALPRLRANLAAALRHRFAESGSAADREEVAELLAAVVRDTTAPPSLRARAARAVCADADMTSARELRRAAGLLETAAALLPDIAPRRLGRRDQQGHLAGFGGLARDAAALALASGGDASAARALGLLEAGRGVLLGQALETRTDLTSLRLRHPRLADRYVRLRNLLDAEHAFPGAADGVLSLERAAGDRQRLAAAFGEVVAQIRSRAGFSGFMLPPSAAELAAQARDGPVAVLNVSHYRSDALLLTATGVTSVPLPQLTPAAVQARALSLRDDLDGTLNETLDWLWETAAKPVLDALGRGSLGPGALGPGALGPGSLGPGAPASPAAGPLPRMWWMPTGALSLLPLHAAGQVMDRVVSSYVPTLRALAHARAARASGAAPRSLVVSMPFSPGGAASPPGGAASPPGAAEEIRLLRSVLPGPRILTQPGRAEVLRRLSGCAIAHFACHGITNAADPSRTGLVLADGPLTVADLAPARLSGARLAYLSACDTAACDADEAIHITSAFQLAGFSHVVGTLWPVAEAVAGRFAADFHSALRAGPWPSGPWPAGAARALHQTARQARARFPSRPSAWAGYVHAGP
jgi:hypothetical protein